MARCLLAVVSIALVGCVQSKSAAWESARFMAFGPPNANIEALQLNPAVRYLRLTVNGTEVLLGLGFIDRDTQGRAIEVWYSGDREVLRLQGGRLVGLVGTPVEWRSVRLPERLPEWAATSAVATYLRTRDEMPGYRIGLVERMTLTPIPPPSDSKLRQLAPSQLQWFSETASPAPDETLGARKGASAALPARYAIQRVADAMRVVYGEQCLDEHFCLTWQPWPPVPGTAVLQ